MTAKRRIPWSRCWDENPEPIWMALKVCVPINNRPSQNCHTDRRGTILRWYLFCLLIPIDRTIPANPAVPDAPGTILPHRNTLELLSGQWPAAPLPRIPAGSRPLPDRAGRSPQLWKQFVPCFLSPVGMTQMRSPHRTDPPSKCGLGVFSVPWLPLSPSVSIRFPFMFVFYQLSPDRSVTLSLAFETIASWRPLSEHLEMRNFSQ